MLSSICFSLANQLSARMFNPITKVSGPATIYPVMSADVVFHASNYPDLGLVIYREYNNKTYIFTSDGYDWTPVE